MESLQDKYRAIMQHNNAVTFYIDPVKEHNLQKKYGDAFFEVCVEENVPLNSSDVASRWSNFKKFHLQMVTKKKTKKSSPSNISFEEFLKYIEREAKSDGTIWMSDGQLYHGNQYKVLLTMNEVAPTTNEYKYLHRQYLDLTKNKVYLNAKDLVDAVMNKINKYVGFYMPTIK